MTSYSLIIVTYYLVFPLVSSSKILAVLPALSYSHYFAFQPLLLSLASRGHEITVITTFPSSSTIDNYKEIDISGHIEILNQSVPLLNFDSDPLITALHNSYLFIPQLERVFHHPSIKDLMNSNTKFDLVITEEFITDMFLVFGYKFGAPVIVLSSSGIYTWSNDKSESVENPSYIVNQLLPFSMTMSIWERIQNIYYLIVPKLYFKFYHKSLSEKIAREAFGESLPSLKTLSNNVSLFFVNSHHTIHGVRPLSPKVVEIGGYHVEAPRPLPKDLENWIQESRDGFIFVSFGSVLRGSSMPSEKVQSFLEVFKTLPQRVLWKYEDEPPKYLPPNVKLVKWVPQMDLLGHPEIKVFISHGGMMGVIEAVANGVPVLGVPVFGDQPHNIASLVDKGAAVMVHYKDISVESLSKALTQLLNDTSYYENAKSLSRRFLDRPQSPKDTAVYWTEYVIKHGGVKHLKSVAAELPWYQYLLLDVAVVCLAYAVFVLVLVYCVIKLLKIASLIIAKRVKSFSVIKDKISFKRKKTKYQS